MSENQQIPIQNPNTFQAPQAPSQKYDLWYIGSYTNHYFGVRISQSSESRVGVTITDLERGIALMNLLDEEEKSKGYVLKKEGYRGEIVARSPKALIASSSIDDVKAAIKEVLRTKIDRINTQQNMYPVEVSCGGVQVFIERLHLNPVNILAQGNINSQSFVSCFFIDPAVPGVKRPISLRYYRTSGGKCQYTYFGNDLNTIFGTEIARSIADHKKLLKACVMKYNQVTEMVENDMKITPEEITTLISVLGEGVIN